MSAYGEFLVDFERKHADFTHRNDPRNDRAAVIVETRPHFFLPKVVRNVMYFLGPGWNLYLVTTPATAYYLTRALPGWQLAIGRVPPHLLGWNGHLPVEGYNRILAGTEFWHWLREEKVLTFQTDTLLTGPRVEEFLEYDYVGAPCGPFDGLLVLNGGLALRTRDVMLACLGADQRAEHEPEDHFFSRAVSGLGAAVADTRTAARFAVESVFLEHPVGVHGTDKFYHSMELAQHIVAAITY